MNRATRRLITAIQNLCLAVLLLFCLGLPSRAALPCNGQSPCQHSQNDCQIALGVSVCALGCTSFTCNASADVVLHSNSTALRFDLKHLGQTSGLAPAPLLPPPRLMVGFET
jgi:hypothetical protein